MSKLKMARRARISYQEDLIEQESLKFEQYQISLAHKPLRKNSTMQKLLNEIYNIFDPYLDKPDIEPTYYLRAVEFEFLQEQYSKPTIVKAKKMLGIKSFRKNDMWYWTMPKRSPIDSMQRYHDIKLQGLKQAFKNSLRKVKWERPAASILREMLEFYNYDVLADTIKEDMINRGYSTKTAVRMKAAIGVLSIKNKDGWHWVWPAEPVQLWLTGILENGPLPMQEIYNLGAEKKWTKNLVNATRLTCGGIRFCYINNQTCWRDVNATRS